MSIENSNVLKLLLVIVFLSMFFTGCVHTVSLGIIDAVPKWEVEEILIDSYKIIIYITPSEGKNEFIYSFSLSSNITETILKDVKLSLHINKVSNYPQLHYRHRHDKYVHIDELEPSKIDSETGNYYFNYKFEDKRKYYLLLHITKIEGKSPENEIEVSFVQNIR